jgi:hypothetical protein
VIEEEFIRIISFENSDSSNHLSLKIDINSFVVFLRKSTSSECVGSIVAKFLGY